MSHVEKKGKTGEPQRFALLPQKTIRQQTSKKRKRPIWARFVQLVTQARTRANRETRRRRRRQHRPEKKKERKRTAVLDTPLLQLLHLFFLFSSFPLFSFVPSSSFPSTRPILHRAAVDDPRCFTNDLAAGLLCVALVFIVFLILQQCSFAPLPFFLFFSRLFPTRSPCHEESAHDTHHHSPPASTTATHKCGKTKVTRRLTSKNIRT